MSILSSTQTGGEGILVNEEFLINHNFTIVNGQTRKFAINNEMTMRIRYDSDEKLWFFNIVDEKNRILRAYVKNYNDFLIFCKYQQNGQDSLEMLKKLSTADVYMRLKDPS